MHDQLVCGKRFQGFELGVHKDKKAPPKKMG